MDYGLRLSVPLERLAHGRGLLLRDFLGESFDCVLIETGRSRFQALARRTGADSSLGKFLCISFVAIAQIGDLEFRPSWTAQG